MAGHRLLLVHLFLPDTLSFHDWASEDENTHYRAPSQQLGNGEVPQISSMYDAPPSPPTNASHELLPVHELQSRLAETSKQHHRSAPKSSTDDEDALSDSDSPFQVTEIPRKARSARSSFNEQSKKISMSLLMSEAAQGSSSSDSGLLSSAQKRSTSPSQSSLTSNRSRRNSPSGGTAPPVILTQSPKEDSIPLVSDHGRAASSEGSPMLAPISLPGQSASASSSSSLISSTSRSRRGSTSNSLGQSLSMTSTITSPYKEGSGDGGGTRAPGARVSGKAGTMTPLSIIGDLAAKQSAVQPRQLSTPGDSERHHPFGSGAVTPMRTSHTPGPSRPGGGQKPFLQRALSRTPMSLPPENRSGEPASNFKQTDVGPSKKMGPNPMTSMSRIIASPATIDRSSSDGPEALSTSRQTQSTVSSVPKQPTVNHATVISPAMASSAKPVRAVPKGRASSRASLGRRSSTISGPRASFRRESSASVDLTQDDVLEEEGCPTPSLPPYDFAPNPSSNGGLTNAVSSLSRDRLRSGKVYIGTPGISTASWANERERNSITERFYKERNSLPVWVDDDDFEGAYNQFCKQILWPTFHYALATQKGLDNEHESFRKYRTVNEKFAEAIVGEYKEGDIIWVNDYHLLLVPQMAILRGMLGSDLIGFQTHHFCRHFRQTVSRILQLEATPKGIHMDGRGGFVTVAPFPIGIDVRSLNRRRAEPDVSDWVDKLRTRYEGKKVIVGRDKLDWIKGVRQKLLAFEIFLNEHSEWVGKVVLIQVALATTEENEEVAAATEVIARINNKYSTLTYQPVVFLHVQDITFSQYLALLTIADCCLNSSRREGMGLTPHEYVVCQEEKHRPLILSELSGTYSALQACIGINPWNTKQMAHAIYKALTMSDEEAFDRWKDLHRQVVTQTAQHWIQSLLGRLEKAHINRERRNNFFIPRLEIGQLVSEWRASKSRLLVFDLEDTLLEEGSVSKLQDGSPSTEKIIDLLQELCSDARNRVYVLSGRGASDLDALAARIPRIGLVAENGCAVMYAGQPHDEEVGKEWTSLVAGTDFSWRAPVKEILSYFTERTPGSQLEDRGCSIMWRFWSSDAIDDDEQGENRDFQWSRRQAAEVQNLIYDSLGERFSLRIIPGETGFLIMPKNTSRTSAIQHIISLSHIGETPLTLANATVGGNHDITASPNGGGGGSISTHGRSLLHYSPLDKAQSEKVSTDGSTFKQPSNDWQRHRRDRTPTISSRPLSMMTLNGEHLQKSRRASTNPYTLHPNGMGSFDFVLSIGQDDQLLSYLNSLDLPFAPVTSTSTYCDEDGKSHNEHGGGSSEANYYLEGVEDVFKCLTEVVAFKGREEKWGRSAMDV